MPLGRIEQYSVKQDRTEQVCSPADAEIAEDVVSLFMSLSCFNMFKELKYERDYDGDNRRKKRVGREGKRRGSNNLEKYDTDRRSLTRRTVYPSGTMIQMIQSTASVNTILF